MKPFWALSGEIHLLKRIKCQDRVEETWEDENGDRAVINRPANDERVDVRRKS